MKRRILLGCTAAASVFGLTLVGLATTGASAAPVAPNKTIAGKLTCPVSQRDYLGWCTLNLSDPELTTLYGSTAPTADKPDSVVVSPGDPTGGARAYSSNNVWIVDYNTVKVRPRDQWAHPYGGTIANGSLRVWPSDETLTAYYVASN